MSVDPAKSTTQLPSTNSILGAVPLVNVAASKTLGLLQKPAGTNQVPSQIAPMVSSRYIYFLLFLKAETILVLSMCFLSHRLFFVLVQWSASIFLFYFFDYS